MADDLRVALRINANAGNGRREIEQLNRQLRRTGQEGAAGLNREALRAGATLSQAGRKGAQAFRQTRTDMRAAATGGSAAFKQASREMTTALERVTQELRDLRRVGTEGAQELERDFRDTDSRGIRSMRESVDRTNTSFRRMARNGGRELGTLKRLAAGVRGEFERLRRVGGSTAGMLGMAGGGYLAGAQLKQSAMRDRQWIRTQQTAGMTPTQRDGAREQLWQASRQYGVDVGQLESGYGTLIASGLSNDAASTSIDAIGQATAVTGADASILAKSLVAGASAFNIDLSQVGAAQALLEKMTVAGRLGNAELENLADIFPKIGDKAREAGMSVGETLGFAETLSLVELDPSRLGTLAESTLRLFTNKTYRDNVTEETDGALRFYDDEGRRRSTIDVFRDIKGIYDRLPTDQAQGDFIGNVFKGMDQDTLRGMRTLLDGSRLDQFAATAGDIDNAKPVFAQDLRDNVDSATGTGGRMRATLGQAMDEMMRPINAALADAGSYLLDDLGLDGKDILLGGALGGAAIYGGARGASALGSQLFGGANTLKNIAVGSALEDATGVQPVYVVNWPGQVGMGPRQGGVDGGGGKPRSGGGRSGSPSRGGGWRAYVSQAGRYAKGGAPLMLLPSAVEAYQIATSDMSDDARATAYGGLTGRTGGAVLGGTAGGMLAGPPGALLGGGIGFLAGDLVGSHLPGWMAPLVDGGRGESPSGGFLGADLSNLRERFQAPQVGESHSLPSSGMGSLLPATEARLSALLDKPLVIELRTDSDWLYGEIENRAGIQMRRGQ